MKYRTYLIALSLGVLFVASDKTDGQTSPILGRMHWNGGAAGARWGDELTAFEVYVREDRTAGANTANLSFNGYWADPASKVCEQVTVPCNCEGAACAGCEPYTFTECRYTRSTWQIGFGPIPVKDVQIASGGARLNTNISSNPGFTFLRCTGNTVAGVFDCGNIPPVGTVAFEWRKSRDAGFNYGSGMVVNRRGPIAWHVAGFQRVQEAIANGTLLGVSVQNSWAELATGNNVSIEISRE